MRNVIWSPEAEKELYNILIYWIYRNRSTTYSIRLEEAIQQNIRAIVFNPEIGKLTNRQNIRLKLVEHYWIVYEITPNQIMILSIFDTRQDDKKLKKKIKS